MRAGLPAWIGLALLATGFAADLHLDVRERDAFSWMDPYQYYEFALGVVEGREDLRGFEIPSLFPFAVMPLLAVEPSIPAALCIGFAALLLLLAALPPLCRELGIRAPPPLVAALVLSSPLLLGLSRTLYVEFSLTALSTWAFLCWLRFARRPGLASGAAFGAVFGAGFLTKTTFPLFLIPPVAAAVLGRLSERRFADASRMLAASVVPLALGAAVHASIFTPSLGYYVNLVSTSRPFMYLMGPPEVLSLSSATYYFGQIGRGFLFLLTPLLVLAPLAAWRRRAGFRWRDLAGPRAALWLWLLGPLVLLAAHPLKEPRHAAPCVVPAVLLLVQGIEALSSRALRTALLAAALLLAAAQYLAVTRGGLETPYFLDHPLRLAEIEQQMRAASPGEDSDGAPPDLQTLHWRYNQNLAIAGFPPNEALALTWHAFPGVVFDLDTLDDPTRLSDAVPFRRFEDLYFLAAVNTYNRRCGWHAYHRVLPRETIVANADFLLLQGSAARDLEERYPDHVLVATVEREAGNVAILRSRHETTPFRSLYARAFLERNPQLAADELRVIVRELLLSAALRGDATAVRHLVREFPVLGEGDATARNIYWIAGYPALIRYASERMRPMLRGDGVGAPTH